MGWNFSQVSRTSDRSFYAPLRWEACRIFACSLSDFLIQEADSWRNEAWEIVRRSQQHTYMILTKRPERFSECLPPDWPLKNVELGVSVETPEYLSRLDHLKNSGAIRIFVSCEPLLAPLDLLSYLVPDKGHPLDGVMVGGESGADYRIMEEPWAIWIREQCRATNTAFFFKQHSGLRPGMEPLLEGLLYQALPGEGFKEFEPQADELG